MVYDCLQSSIGWFLFYRAHISLIPRGLEFSLYLCIRSVIIFCVYGKIEYLLSVAYSIDSCLTLSERVTHTLYCSPFTSYSDIISISEGPLSEVPVTLRGLVERYDFVLV